jgi:hypothetical protein
MARYADDFVILCRTEAEAQQALWWVQDWTTNNGLRLHPEKTRIVDATVRGGFDFRGYPSSVDIDGHGRRAPRRCVTPSAGRRDGLMDTP